MREIARGIARERQEHVPKADRKKWWHDSWKDDIVKEAYRRMGPARGPSRRAMPASASTARSGDKRPREHSTCVICMDAEPNVVLIPCGHMCMCSDCALVARQQHENCPLCRSRVRLSSRVYSS